MADDNIVTTKDEGFEPEPIPDNIADTELNGLDPAESSTDDEQVETEQDETQQDQQTEDASDEDEEADDDSGNPDEQEAANDKDDGQKQEQPNEQQEAAAQAFKQRQAARQQRDYVQEQRKAIRDYEADYQQKLRNNELSELEEARESNRIINAKLYLQDVERARSAVINEGQKALSDIDYFKQDTPQSQAVFSQSLQAFRQAYGVYDEQSGELIATEDRYGNPVSLYSYLEQQAAMIEQARQDEQRQVRRSETKMRAKAVNPSNPGKVTSSGDELSDLLDKIGDMPLN